MSISESLHGLPIPPLLPSPMPSLNDSAMLSAASSDLAVAAPASVDAADNEALSLGEATDTAY